MFRDVRECLDAGNRLHTLLASQKPSRKSIPILIDVEQGICNGSLGIFKELNPAVYYFCLFIFFKKKYYQTIKNLKLHLVKYFKNLTANKCFNYENYNNVVVKHS